MVKSQSYCRIGIWGDYDDHDRQDTLERRFTQLFKYGVFDRSLKQTPIDFTENGAKARDIGVKASVLLQNNSALPFDAKAVKKVVLIGKKSQIYAQQVAAEGAHWLVNRWALLMAAPTLCRITL